MKPSAAFWDGVARRYARTPVRDLDIYQQTLDRTASYLSPGHRVLELGCGTGTTAIHLSPAVARITASDISGEMIGIARARAWDRCATNVDFAVADLFDAALDGPHDVVMAFNLLHLVEDLPRALARIAELLPPDGLFVSKTPCLGGGNPLVRVVIPLMQMVGKAPHVSWLTIDGLDAAVRAAGFDIVERGLLSQSAPGRFLVARKRR